MSTPQPIRPALTAVVKVTGDDVAEIVRHLEEAAYLLGEQPHARHREIIGSGIVVMRPTEDAPVVDWREDHSGFAPSAEDPSAVTS